MCRLRLQLPEHQEQFHSLLKETKTLRLICTTTTAVQKKNVGASGPEKYTEAFIKKQIEEFNLGKRHLANMMGEDPETFTQEDIDGWKVGLVVPTGLNSNLSCKQKTTFWSCGQYIDSSDDITEFLLVWYRKVKFINCEADCIPFQLFKRAIAYLFPSGLFDEQARPVMKHPNEVFPEQRKIQWGEDGRPFNFLFYTGKQSYYSLMHYSRFIQLLQKLVALPCADIEEKYIQKFSKEVPVQLQKVVIEPLQYDERGVAFSTGEGKRKTARATAVVYDNGTGRITVNGIDILHYFPVLQDREQLLFPFQFLDRIGKHDMVCTVSGGGRSAQAGAIRLATAKALRSFVTEKEVEFMRQAMKPKLSSDFAASFFDYTFSALAKLPVRQTEDVCASAPVLVPCPVARSAGKPGLSPCGQCRRAATRWRSSQQNADPGVACGSLGKEGGIFLVNTASIATDRNVLSQEAPPCSAAVDQKNLGCCNVLSLLAGEGFRDIEVAACSVSEVMKLGQLQGKSVLQSHMQALPLHFPQGHFPVPAPGDSVSLPLAGDGPGLDAPLLLRAPPPLLRSPACILLAPSLQQIILLKPNIKLYEVDTRLEGKVVKPRQKEHPRQGPACPALKATQLSRKTWKNKVWPTRNGERSCTDQLSGTTCKTRPASNSAAWLFKRSTAAMTSAQSEIENLIQSSLTNHTVNAGFLIFRYKNQQFFNLFSHAVHRNELIIESNHPTFSENKGPAPWDESLPTKHLCSQSFEKMQKLCIKQHRVKTFYYPSDNSYAVFRTTTLKLQSICRESGKQDNGEVLLPKKNKTIIKKIISLADTDF
ncbi:hypothetical protein IHE44_0005162 [Lamprotornis superbus]|uniref:Small ribosomal subunit protein uS9m n=1 Tax=Lamprotornis superbus TaxID=245042 RepID=A0A835TYN9_9PASS|nr:hypothetical protein IHE44_0005162 [Lamprotornis superbus]